MDSAKTAEDQGTFWAPEDRAWLWYNDTIETHAFALRTTMELTPQEPKLDGLVLWLLINKKLNHWKSTRATAEVVYSLAGLSQGHKATGGQRGCNGHRSATRKPSSRSIPTSTRERRIRSSSPAKRSTRRQPPRSRWRKRRPASCSPLQPGTSPQRGCRKRRGVTTWLSLAHFSSGSTRARSSFSNR